MDITRLLPASYNGIKFLTPNQTIKWGVRTITHTYPKSDRTEVEFMGLSKRQFTMEIVIHGDNYIEKRDEFQDELNKSEYGTLIHPIDGEIKVAVMQDWNLTENNTELGIGRFNVVFQEVSDSVAPDMADTQFGKILNEISTALESSRDFLNNNYATNFLQSVQLAQNQIENIAGQIEFQAKKITNTLNDITALVDDVVNNSFGIANDVSLISDAIDEMFSTLASLGSSESNFNAMQGMFNSGDDIVINNLTAANAESQTNTDSINSVVQLQALLYAYNAIINVYLYTYSQMEYYKNLLDAQYFKIYDGLDDVIKNQLDILRNEANSYFSGLELYNTREITAHGESLNVILYQYYGNLDLYDYIKQLNGIVNDAIITGTITILDK